MKKTPFLHRLTPLRKLLFFRVIFGIVRMFSIFNVKIATFFTNVIAPLTALTVAIEPIQSGSGDPSPQNQRAISGRTSAVVSQSDRNLFDSANIALITVDGNGNERYGMSIEGVGTYIIRATQTGNSAYIYVKVKNANGTYGSASSLVGSSGYYGEITKTLTEGQKLLIYDYSNDAESTAKTKLTSWGIYTATVTSHTAQLGQTVYGGDVRWTEGKCDSKYGIATYTGSSDEDWVYGTHPTSGQGRVTCRIPNDALLETNDLYGNIIKANDTVKQYPSDWCACITAGSQLAIGVPSTITSADAFKTFLASNNLQVIYPLATPTEITLSDLDTISTVEGQNNVWADCGNILELTYRKRA